MTEPSYGKLPSSLCTTPLTAERTSTAAYCIQQHPIEIPLPSPRPCFAAPNVKNRGSP
jgi:hypothetical protein